MQDSATAGRPRWRGPAIVAANPRGAIYGTIVATAVIGASATGGKAPELILIATVATLLVFWLAHVYADVLDHGLRHGRAAKAVGSIMAQELSMLAAPAPSILFLLLGGDRPDPGQGHTVRSTGQARPGSAVVRPPWRR